MTKDEFDKLLPLVIPRRIAICPICGSDLQIEGVDEWFEPQPGVMAIDEHTGQISFDCVTQPDIDGPEWWDWHRGHWSMPYVDWMPLERPVIRWLGTFLRKRVKVTFSFDDRSLDSIERIKAQGHLPDDFRGGSR